MKVSYPFDFEALLAWYYEHRREMPWRGHPSPYAVWVSEIMLQQTQVDTARPYFDRFMEKFPTVWALAEAESETVLKAWEGLGYYARARNLQRAAQHVVCEHGGDLPDSSAALLALPGVGDYTAAAISSICFGEPAPVVDGNVARVFSRVFLLDDDFKKPTARRALAERLRPAFECVDSPGDLNQAMMELGALVCRPRQPACDVCPLASECGALREGCQEAYPLRREAVKVPVREHVALVLRRGAKWLMVQRDETGLMGGLWELPSGEILQNETVNMAAQRIGLEMTGLQIKVQATAGEVKHVFSHFVLKLAVLEAKRVGGRFSVARNPAFRWVTADDLDVLPIATAHWRALELAQRESR